MFPSNSPPNGGFPQHSGNNNNGIYGNIQGMAITLAIAATFIASPYIVDFTQDFVDEIFAEHYGGLAQFLSWGWEVLVFVFTFFLCRAYVTGAVITIGLWVATRIPAVMV